MSNNTYTDAQVQAMREHAVEMYEALMWYACMSKRMGSAAIHQDSQEMLRLMKEIAVDYGAKGKTIINRVESAK